MDLVQRLRRSLAGTRSLLEDRLGGADAAVSAEALEEALLAADVGVELSHRLAGELADAGRRTRTGAGGGVEKLSARILEVLTVPAPEPVRGTPHVTLVVGVNGSGKTTTAAKLAGRRRHEGRNVLLVAADTFRAAAIEQLQHWGERIGVPVVAPRTRSDPGAVVFDALRAGATRGCDEVIVDTAGRLHTKHNLMAELEKVRRVSGRAVAGAPHEVLLVLDATTGSNGVAQAREFVAHAGVTGIALVKLDGTAKGGVVLAIAHELGVPVRWVGVGEAADDLLLFDPAAFASALLEGLT